VRCARPARLARVPNASITGGYNHVIGKNIDDRELPL
jgi:hypothetical protein